MNDLAQELKKYSDDLVDSSEAYDRGSGGVFHMISKVERLEQQYQEALQHINCLVIFASGSEPKNAPHTVKEASEFLLRVRGQ
ncbi:MAG: hypothetical protein HUJ30_00705 [Gammaproteobacteria bacterium]|nr:hypothetical protein [Gammaproteobacteria bacterium]